MSRTPIPLNALRAFEAAARHRSFTRAAEELCVTQAAISHQVKSLEDRLGVSLFRRSNRGLLLTDEGVALAPTLFESFGAIDRLFDQFESGGAEEVLTVSAVGTFVLGALLERLPAFRAAYPLIDLRLLTNNNKVDLVAEGLDYATLSAGNRQRPDRPAIRDRNRCGWLLADAPEVSGADSGYAGLPGLASGGRGDVRCRGSTWGVDAPMQ